MAENTNEDTQPIGRLTVEEVDRLETLKTGEWFDEQSVISESEFRKKLLGERRDSQTG